MSTMTRTAASSRVSSVERPAERPTERPVELPPMIVAQVVLQDAQDLGASFRRLTFVSDGPTDRLAHFGVDGPSFDQRIKLVFPPEGGFDFTIPQDWHDWYGFWRAIPEARRGSMRTYTVREVSEVMGRVAVVVDFVIHEAPGRSGPASRFAATAAVGDPLLLVGPRRGYPFGGIEFDPGVADHIVMAGDETALPAIAKTLWDLRDLDRDWCCRAGGRAFIEVADAADIIDLRRPPGIEIQWLVRGGAPVGERLIPAVRGHFGLSERSAPSGQADATHAAAAVVDIWETPTWSGAGEELSSGTADPGSAYVWIAGESGIVSTLRRALVGEAGLQRSQVAFMGYWRLGVTQGG